MKRRKIILFIIMVTVIISTLAAYSNDTDTLQKELAETNRNLEKNRAEQKRMTDELGKIALQIQEYDLIIDKTEKEIKVLGSEIGTTEKKIDIITGELIEAEENIDQKQDLLGSRLNVMYKNGNIGYAEVLLSSRSFPELLSNLDMIKKIVQHDVDLLKFLEIERNKIEDGKVKLENEKAQLISLKNNVEDKKEQLVVSRGQQEGKRRELLTNRKALSDMEDRLERQANEIADEIRRKTSDGEYIAGEMQWPVPGHTRVSSPYGNRVHPILGGTRFHSGIDIPAPTGTEIIAAGMGTVIFAGDLGGYGKTVIIDHGGDVTTLYAHNSKLDVSEGDEVNGGQKIAEAGSTGLSTGPHLHFEVREDGKYVDPTSYVKRN
ncbi:murein hydrolase activator EnvC family protein [Alkaliphilus peptidifermentans]|uniref:Peptidase family M23 n=1 Tax=Alkaliphilus peptidifermentans DSM 18978 TaxID=1120976 RepID=A0A1G5GAC9_9FIRM|nr:M23 family metallopeptidase [Alkaliphilus peptidifermentans]SCY48463.1 Peptidase family M23 [Alkaliphilus peptidifermentans DSM 18978]